MITQEEYEQLLPFEADFRRAVKARYKLPTLPQENMLVESILKKYEPKERFNWSCGNCALRVYTRLGWKFYEYKEWLEKQTTTTPTESTSSMVVEDTTSVKEGQKRGRKKTKATKAVVEA